MGTLIFRRFSTPLIIIALHFMFLLYPILYNTFLFNQLYRCAFVTMLLKDESASQSIGPSNTTRGSGERFKLPQRVWGGKSYSMHFSFKTWHLVAPIFPNFPERYRCIFFQKIFSQIRIACGLLAARWLCQCISTGQTVPILHRFGAIRHVLCAPDPHPYSTLILGVFPLHQIAHVGVSERMGLKLFGHEIIFEEFQPMWSRYLNVTDGRTDRQTTCNLITALCASIGR